MGVGNSGGTAQGRSLRGETDCHGLQSKPRNDRGKLGCHSEGRRPVGIRAFTGIRREGQDPPLRGERIATACGASLAMTEEKRWLVGSREI